MFPVRRLKPIKRFFATLILDDKELDAFGLWAFGDGVFEISESINFLKAWNGLHADALNLEPSSMIVDDAPKMIKLWRDSLA